MSALVMVSVRPIVSDPATNDAMNNNQENQTIPGNYNTGEETKQKPQLWVHAKVAIDFHPLPLVSSYWIKLSASLSSLSAATVCNASYFPTFGGIDHLQGKLPAKNS